MNLVGDARATLRRLLPLLRRKEEATEWHEEIMAGVDRWREVLRRQAEVPADPVNPQYVAHCLDPLLPDDVMLSVDSASVTTGTPGTSGSAVTCAPPCPGRWPPWAARCRTPSVPSSPARTAPRWPSAATARCR
ncbi:hypothetical protein GCM10009716_42080 [Streptomyces sodiiphilus]|uniref:Uncharacterized protein n=1 Tax=Streptomyces sodiiphilus TaxID=226217 RepID=A0ABN2PSZ9_9ACTN